jgi:hypothetical protein
LATKKNYTWRKNGLVKRRFLNLSTCKILHFT